MLRTFDGDSPVISDSAFVSEMAYLVGDVAVDAEASVWPFVCIRGDYGPTTVGRETNVQDFTMLHEAEVGDRVTIGHGVVIDRASVGDHSLIGISSTLLPGSSVGDDCIVAGGAVVREGQEVPDGHLAYGVPAETRPLTAEQREAITWYCDEYVSLASRYREEGGFEA